MRVIYFNNIPAPFMVQFADRMNKLDDMDFYLVAIKNEAAHRGKHWHDTLGVTDHIYYNKDEVPILGWIEQTINKIRPDIIFTGINRGPIFNLLVKKKKEKKYKLGKWNEPYMPKGIAHLTAPFRNLYYKLTWRQTIDFFLAIDDRALLHYRNFLSRPENIFLFPYYEETVTADRPKITNGTIRFLFSGRLANDHNIRGLAKATHNLQKKYPGQFELMVSASGSSKKYLDQAESFFPQQKYIYYDTDFKNWEDRLRPFKSSHVLVLPSYNSGWGLVVNEALNLGLPVITTNKVGSARYLLEHMINGIIIKPTTKEIFHSMEYFILNPDEITRMSFNALDVYKRYSIDIGSKRLKGIFEKILKS